MIYGESGSTAETYAKEHGFEFRESGEASRPTPPAKKSIQTLKVTKKYGKTFGSRPFKLNASLAAGDGALTYISSNTKVVTVDKTNGTVSVKGCGIATITVNAAETAKYKAASASIAITVSPAKLKTPSVKAQAGKKLKVSWKKDKNASGYEIQYSTDKKFKNKKATKVVAVKKNRTISKTIKKLRTGKKYYVRVRSYVNVKIKGKTQKLAGAWSSKKTATIKN